VLRWEGGGDLRSLYVRDGRIVGAQLAGDIRAAGLYRSLMMRKTPIDRFGSRLVEPRFGMGDIVTDALRLGEPAR